MEAKLVIKVTCCYQTRMDLPFALLCLKAKPPTGRSMIWGTDIKSQARSSLNPYHRLTKTDVQDTTAKQNWSQAARDRTTHEVTQMAHIPYTTLCDIFSLHSVFHILLTVAEAAQKIQHYFTLCKLLLTMTSCCTECCRIISCYIPKCRFSQFYICYHPI